MSPLVQQHDGGVLAEFEGAVATVPAVGIDRVYEQVAEVSTHVAALRAQAECAQLYLAEARHNLYSRQLPPPIV